jgi:DNA segregation ATPase FtsK/SpoIIIE, S-DNA-T family
VTPPTLTLVPDPDDPDHNKNADVQAELHAPHPWGAPLDPGPSDLTPTNDGGMAVDSEPLWQPPVERRDVLPAWWRDRTSRRAAIVWWIAHAVHLVKFHGIRLPVYTGRIAWRSPIGFGRALRGVGRWTIDMRTRVEREALVDIVRTGTGAPQLVRLGERHRNNVCARSILLAIGLLVMPLVWFQLSAALQLSSFTILVLALGIVGRPQGQSLTAWAVSKDDGPPPLRQEFLIAALSSIGITRITQALKEDPGAIRFMSDQIRSGTGFRVDIDLPPGVTAGDVVERRSALASALRRHRSQVWPSPDDAHEGRLQLFVAHKPLTQTKAVPWPLATKGRTDVFSPVPIGTNERGELVMLLLAYGAGLVGAIPA